MREARALRRGDARGPTRSDIDQAMLREPNLSLDVFDTVLFRTVSAPGAVFILVGHRLVERGVWGRSAEEFAWARTQAERAARTVAPGGEPTLDEIYERLGSSSGLDGDIRPAIEAELETERRCLVANPHVAKLLAARADPVTFVSDTYLPKVFIEEILRSRGLLRAGDTVYASCEERCSKYEGTLFATVLERHEGRANELLHVGDNSHADVAMAARAGLRSILLPRAGLNRFEELLESHAASTDGFTSLLAGCSRLVRGEQVGGSPHDEALTTVGAGVAAPMLLGFVAWAIEQARAASADLAFVSRDGQFLEELARLVQAQGTQDPIPTVYLPGGRRAWHLPGLAGEPLPAEPPDWLIGEASRRRPEAVAGMLDLSTDAFHDVSGTAPWSSMTTAERHGAVRALWHDPSVRAHVSERAAGARELLCRLLEQHELGRRPWMLVDVGWVGNSALSLQRALRGSGLPTPHHLYFGLFNPVLALHPEIGWSAYFCSGAHPLSRAHKIVDQMVPFLEIVLAADHGGVAGYRDVEGQVEPVLLPRGEPTPEAWGLFTVRNAVRGVLEHALPFQSLLGSVDLRPAVEDVMREILLRPTRAEARAWGSFPFTADPADAEREPWATPVDWRTLVRVANRGWPEGFWPDGTMALLPRPARSALEMRRRLVDSLPSEWRRRLRGVDPRS